MTAIVCWVVSALVLVATAAWLGGKVPLKDDKGSERKNNPLGIIVDFRGRFSLAHFQVVLWSIVVISLVSGVFVARALSGLGPAAIQFGVPGELLIVLGISLGSGASSEAIKAGQDSDPNRTPSAVKESRFSQVFMAEDGDAADKYVDVAKFQNFWLTLVLVLAFIVSASTALLSKAWLSPTGFSLPGFPESVVILLGVSHAGYLAGKLPSPPTT